MRKLVAIVVVMGCAGGVFADEPVRFNRDIRPIMSDTCFVCHGPAKQKAGMRLDLPETALKAAKSGKVPIVAGKPDESEVVRRLFTEDEDDVMPPADSHKSLTSAHKELIKRWIAEGAKFEKHWAFVKPEVGAGGIDQFIEERLKKQGMTMSPEADKTTLIRRVAFALTGLPPTKAEAAEFLSDNSQTAYERMVERYMASPRFGEEMARHWLDVARYADTHGLHLDNERQMWLYRDWVIKAFNDNKRFDQFTIEQIAGDLLPKPTNDQLIATGFNRCNVTTGEGGSIEEEWFYRNAVDRTNTVGETWLGLTYGCAVCHDHKFDPISAKEYYSMYSFFYSIEGSALDGNANLHAPMVKTPSAEQQKRLDDLSAKHAAAQKKIDEAAKAYAYVDPADAKEKKVTAYEEVWFEDDFPSGAKAPGKFVKSAKGEPVLSGNVSLKRTGEGIAQDLFEGGASLSIPSGAEIFVNVWLDEKNPPKAVMLQFHKDGWKHRAVWGDYEIIPWGTAGTVERVNGGSLPQAGKWVRLAIKAEKVGLKGGDVITGYAFTTFGGVSWWDKFGVSGKSDPANDPLRSFAAYRKERAGKDTNDAPADIKKWLKDGPSKDRKPAELEKLRTYYVQYVCVDAKPQFASLVKERDLFKKQRDDLEGGIPGTMVFREAAKPKDTFVMLRGQYDKKGEKVEPATLAALPPLKRAGTRATRLDLAKWLVSPEQPLTARVTANRLWQQFFGVGLVKTSFDFGSQGEVPSHPELLDWLASEFQKSGWDVKHMVRVMVNSNAFKQSAAVTPEMLKADPETRLYARGPRLRLDAEQVRDNALFVSGLLSLEMGGKGVNPYQPSNIWEPVGFAGSNTRFYKQDKGDALYRRSIYIFLKRTAPPPFMSNFDGSNREQVCSRRERSNTPLQALQLMNDIQHVEAARALASRMMTEGGVTSAERIGFAFKVVLSRSPDAEELKIVEAQFKEHVARYGKDVEAAKKLIATGESKPRAELPPAELAAWTMVANTVMNLDETIMRN